MLFLMNIIAFRDDHCLMLFELILKNLKVCKMNAVLFFLYQNENHLIIENQTIHFSINRFI